MPARHAATPALVLLIIKDGAFLAEGAGGWVSALDGDGDGYQHTQIGHLSVGVFVDIKAPSGAIAGARNQRANDLVGGPARRFASQGDPLRNAEDSAIKLFSVEKSPSIEGLFFRWGRKLEWIF